MCNSRFASLKVRTFPSLLRLAPLLAVVLAVAGCVSPPLKARRPRPAAQMSDGTRMVQVRLPVQTEQGTCAPVVTSGVLSYYGIPKSADWLERRAGTTNGGGTDVQRLLNVLRNDVLPGSGAVLREHLGFGMERFERLFKTYNRLAQDKPGAKRIFWTEGAKLRVEKMTVCADPELFQKAANAQPGRDAFWRDVCRAVDRGDPLLWGVVLGVVEEQNLPASVAHGGHFRLIVGYRTASQEIVFADPWGPQHAAKRMPLESAWAETATLHSLHVP